MPTEQCVFLILYIHGILYMYITKYSCILYVAMDLITILLGSLPLAHNAQHSLVIVHHYTVSVTLLTLGAHAQRGLQ